MLAPAVGTNDALRQQFQQMQEQRQNRLQHQRLKQQDVAKTVLVERTEKDPNRRFDSGDDNLELGISSHELNGSELFQDSNDKIRELKDENGRLYKLLREKDQEIRQAKKKLETEKAMMAAGSSAISNDNAAARIVELSKKVRELTSELESERTKSKQFARKCEELTKEMTDSNHLNGSNEIDNKELNQDELKMTVEKLRQTESKVMDLRNQIQSLKAEVKVSQKVLAQEVGEGVSISSLVSGSSGWKGRAQQITILQKKVNELRKQLDEKLDHGSLGNMGIAGGHSEFDEDLVGGNSQQQSARNNNLTERHKEQIRKLEKQRKENQERLAEELKSLEQRNMELKQKVEASKARNNSLSEEMKILKKQNQLLTDKGKHDNELIEMLMKQQSQWKKVAEENSKKTQDDHNISSRNLERNTIDRLRSVISEKEEKIKTLENEIRRLKFSQSDPDSDCELSFGKNKSSKKPKNESDVTAQILAEVLSPGPSRTASRSSIHFEGKPNSDYHQSKSNADYQELNSLYQAVTVERDRFSELIPVLEKRLQEATFKVLESQNELQTERRRNVNLEKQLKKSKLDRTPADGKQHNKKTTVFGAMANSNEDKSETMTSLEEMEMKLDIQRDENEALKAALQSTLKAKEEDLRLYTGMLEETKKVFIMGIRQSRKAAS